MVLFRDDFDAPEPILLQNRDGWELVGVAGYSVAITTSGGNLGFLTVGGSGVDTAVRATQELAADRVVSAFQQGTTSTMGNMVAVRLQDKDNFIGFRHRTASSGTVELWQRSSGSFTLLGSATGQGATGEISVSVESDVFDVTFNGGIIFTVSSVFIADSAYAGVVGRGGSSNWLDWFEVSDDSGAEEPFALRHNPRTNKVIPVLSSPTVTDIGAACVRPRVTKGY